MFDKRSGFFMGRNVIIILLAILLLAAGCGSSKEIDLGADDNGRKVEMKAGQVLVISLESNPTTGYAWEVVNFEEGVLEQAGEPEFKADSKLVGAGGVQTFRFKAAEAGEIELKLLHHRSWEEDVEPLDTFTVQVVVR
ncbi:MAG: protease inhibitor I42 family protein [Anaerolineae bacterium]|nr:protease inhibitor I42 family protein [Anaerolineae bacterium]